MTMPRRDVTDLRPPALPGAIPDRSGVDEERPRAFADRVLAEVRASLVSSWIPALDGVQARLEKGALVADVGGGRGAAAILLAAAFPRSHVFAYGEDAPSVARAHEAAASAGVGERITFEVVGAHAMPRFDEAGGYDLIAYVDGIDGLADPAGAARRAFESLAPGGMVLVVEPVAGAHAEGDGVAASETTLRALFAAAGFRQLRHVADAPLHRVYAVRG